MADGAPEEGQPPAADPLAPAENKPSTAAKSERDLAAKAAAEEERKKALDENPESWSKKIHEIHIACRRGDIAGLQKILSTPEGRKVLDKPDPSGWKPLHHSTGCTYDKVSATFQLKQEDVQSMVQNNDDRTNISQNVPKDMMDALQLDHSTERVVFDSLAPEGDDRLRVNIDIHAELVSDPTSKEPKHVKLIKATQEQNLKDLASEDEPAERPAKRTPLDLLNELLAQIQDKDSLLRVGNVTCEIDTEFKVVYKEFCGYKCTQMLLAAQADPNVVDLCQTYPIHKAIALGQVESVRSLLQHGAKVYVHNIYGDTPLHRAAWCGRFELAEMLLNHTPPEKPKAIDVEEPATPTAEGEEASIIEPPKIELIEDLNMDKYVNERNQFGDTALHHAAFMGRVDCVMLLLKGQEAGDNGQRSRSEAEFTFTNQLGWAPIHCAASRGHTSIVAELLKRWKNRQPPLPWSHLQTTTTGDNFVHLAVRGAGIETINWCLKHQQLAFAKPNKKGEYPADIAIALTTEEKKGKKGKAGKGGKKGKGKKAAAEPEEPEVPIRTIGFFATINMARQDNLRGVLPAVVKETEDQKQAILKKAEAAQKKK